MSDTAAINRRKIFCVLPSMNGGGAEKVMLLLLAGLDPDKYQPVLVLFEKKGAYLEEVPADIQVYCLEKKTRWDILRLPFRLAFLIKQERPGVVLSFLWYANLINVLSSCFRLHNVPVIISVHNFLSTSLTIQRYSGIKRLVTRLFFPMANEVISVSRAAGHDLVSRFNIPEHKVSVIYNGIDKAHIVMRSAEQPEKNYFADETPVIIAVGRLSKQKGFDVLIRAFAEVRKKRMVKLLILGEGDERSYLESVAREAGVSRYVTMPGFISNPYTYIKRSSLYVMSSNFEGFPVVLLEVMACGVPIISTACTSGPDEILENGVTGILVNVGNVGEISGSICNLLGDPVKAGRLALKAKRKVNDWTIEKMVTGHERLISKYCARQGQK